MIRKLTFNFSLSKLKVMMIKVNLDARGKVMFTQAVGDKKIVLYFE